MELLLSKINETKDSTLSQLTHAGEFLCFVLEDGYREIKEPGQTRIPAGRYELSPRRHGEHFEKYKDRYKHDFSISVDNVPGFKNILIHIGNNTFDTQGCLLANYGAEMMKSDRLFKGLNSTGAYLDLYNILAPAFEAKEPVFLTVTR